MKISVTKADIAKGVENFPIGDCPIELALHRSGFPGARVGSSYIWHVAKNGVEIPHPPIVAQFILGFDSTKKGEPFTFTLPIK